MAQIDPARAAENNTARILGVTGFFHFLALSIVALRLYTRIKLVRAPGRDDIVMGFAAVSYSCSWYILEGHRT
jgi:hypothetical protein